MKSVAANFTLLHRQFSILTNNAVTNSALHLALECTKYVSAPRQQTIDNAIVGESNDALSVAEPGVPAFFFHGEFGCI